MSDSSTGNGEIFLFAPTEVKRHRLKALSSNLDLTRRRRADRRLSPIGGYDGRVRAVVDLEQLQHFPATTLD